MVVEGEEDLPAAIAEVSDGATASAVVKPRVGAGGRGVVVFDGTDGGPTELDESALGPGPWVVQPLVESVRDRGGDLGVRARRPGRLAGAEGPGRGRDPGARGSTAARRSPCPSRDEAAELARRTVEAAGTLLGEPLDYARVDQMRLADGTLAVSELEVTEPGLYLDVLPGNADAFADLWSPRAHAVADRDARSESRSRGRNPGPDVCTRWGRVLKMQLALSR